MRKAYGPLLLALLTQGCGTVAVHMQPAQPLRPYAGLNYSAHEVSRSWQAPRLYGEVFFWIYDVPLSLIFDTVTLPYDLGVMLSHSCSASTPHPQPAQQRTD